MPVCALVLILIVWVLDRIFWGFGVPAWGCVNLRVLVWGCVACEYCVVGLCETNSWII